jgi:hypothetical protein
MNDEVWNSRQIEVGVQVLLCPMIVGNLGQATSWRYIAHST